MSTRPLCLALLIALAFTGQAHAHRRWFPWFGFLDYRHSLDPYDDPHYRHHRAHVEGRLHYAFHHMTASEARALWAPKTPLPKFEKVVEKRTEIVTVELPPPPARRRRRAVEGD